MVEREGSPEGAYDPSGEEVASNDAEEARTERADSTDRPSEPVEIPAGRKSRPPWLQVAVGLPIMLRLTNLLWLVG